MDLEKCPICENHTLVKTPRIRILGNFFGTEYLRGTEQTVLCLKCKYESDKIFTPAFVQSSWWKKIIGYER